MQCSQCNHTIPDSVSFCAYCGASVRRTALAFTFPQGQAAGDIPSLVAYSARHWDYARENLYNGRFEKWLDTAQFNPIAAVRAREIVASEANQDLGLDHLLRELVPTFPPPQVTVQPPQLSGGDLPWQQQRALSFVVQNAGSGCLMGQVRSRAAWLRIQPTEFSCVSGRSVPVQVTLNAAALDPGQQYRGELEVQGGTGGQVTVPVTVTVPAPRLEVTPTALDLGSGYAGEQLTQTLMLHNRGGSAFEAEIGSPARWLEAQPASVRLEPGQSAAVTLAANTGGMPVGAHTAQVQVIARAGAWQAQAAVPVAVALPKLKTLRYRWSATLDYVAAGIVVMVVLLFAMRFIELNVVFWLGLLQAASWATLLGIGLGIFLAWKRKPTYRQYSGIGAVVVGCVTVLGLGALWLQPAYRMSCYDQGVALRKAGEWEPAIAAFAQCGDYRDARQQQAQAAIAVQDWEAAVTAAERLQAVDMAQGVKLLIEIYALPEARAALRQVRSIDGMVMVYVPAGEFQMGSENGDSNERPVHTVALAAFWIDQTEVTNAQYQRCVAAGVCQPSRYTADNDYNGAKQPVVGVSWDDAVTYATWVGGRLPTEAEWEYAARGPEGLTYPWGNEWDCARGNFNENCDTHAYTAPVGSFPEGASWVGALDMAGNLREWVVDWYGEYPSEKRVNPTGPASGTYRVLRGGAFFDDQSAARCAYRYRYFPPYSTGTYNGFRVVVSPSRP